jgi:hypothetical protein
MIRLRIKWLAGVIYVLLLASTGSSLFAQRQDLPTERDEFFYQVALEFADPALCKKISTYASSGGSDWATPPGYQISYLQSYCYYNLAGAMRDLSLCDHVRPLSTSSYDGSKFNPQDCRLKSQSAPAGSAVDPHTVVQWLQKLGYGADDIHEGQYRTNLKNSISDAYDQLRQESLFEERIEGAPSFDEPFAVAKIRPANDLEYMYEMFGVDSNQAIVCDKISPNAQAKWRDGRPFYVRLDCYRDIAFNSRDLAACERLPLRSAVPPGGTEYDSRETCRENIPALMHPDTRNYMYGPERPPTFASFQSGLRKLGYNPTFPELTWREYGDFLMYLNAPLAEPGARAEFLRRVEALK